MFLHIYSVCKDGNFTIFWKWNTAAYMLYFIFRGIILQIRNFSTVRYKILH